MKYCGMCGAPMEDTWAVCAQCGTSAQQQETTVAATPAVPAPMADPPVPTPPEKKKGGAGKVILIIVLVLVGLALLVVGGGALWEFVLADLFADDTPKKSGDKDDDTEVTTTVDDEEETDGEKTDDEKTDDEKTGDENPNAAEMAKLVGDWQGMIDVYELDKAGAFGEDELGIDLSGIKMPITFSFREDGTYAFGIRDEDMREMFKLMFVRYFEAMIEAEGWDMTVEELLAYEGYTIDEIIDESMADGDFESFWEPGVWKAENGKLYMEDTVEEISDDEYIPYVFDETAGTLVFLTPITAQADELEEMGLMFPMTLYPLEDTGEFDPIIEGGTVGA